MARKTTEILFASARPARLERNETLPAKFMRLLDRLPIQKRVRGKTVAIKMHTGGGIGYSTIHPLFVKLLVDHVKKGKPRRVFITDGSVKKASDRGYHEKTVGAPLVSSVGENGKNVAVRRTGWKPLESVKIGKPILEADVLINFVHVKGHGACGFGGACKNLAMGCVPSLTRRDIHALEGSLKWDRTKCIHCKKCIKECEMKANSFTKDGEYQIFWHNCKGCLHCMLACPTKAIGLVQRDFRKFQEGLARVTKLVLDSYDPADVFHINMITDVTLFCDCWGLTTPALIPDVGILACQDIVAIDQASLDAVRTRDLIPGSITPPYKLGKGKHLFERLHAKDPYIQVRELEKLGAGTRKYRRVEVA